MTNETLVIMWTLPDPSYISELISKLTHFVEKLVSILILLRGIREIIEEAIKIALALLLSTIISEMMLMIYSSQSMRRRASIYKRFCFRVKAWFKCFLFYTRRREETLEILKRFSKATGSIKLALIICIVILAAVIVQQIRAHTRP